MRLKIKGLLFFLILAVALSFSISGGAANDIFINSYYALSAYSERAYVPYSDQVALGWGEVREKDGTIYFSQQKREVNPNRSFDYGVPSGDIPAQIKDMRKNGTKIMLSIFLNDTTVFRELLDSKAVQNDIIRQITSDLRIKYFDYSQSPDVNGNFPVRYVSDASGFVEYDGIIIDFEGLRDRYDDAPDRSYSQAFDDFLDNLKAALPKGKVLGVCLHPKRDGIIYYDGYDYAHIGSVADQVILMAHDYQYYSPNPQYTIWASAPYNQVEEAIRLAVADIPPQKILLNLSLSPVQWTKGKAGYTNISYGQMLDALEGRLPDQKVIYVTPPQDRFNQYYKVGYAYLKREFYNNGQYQYTEEDEFYFENKESIEAKMELVKKYGLKGLSIWRLGLGATDVLNSIFASRLPLVRLGGEDRYGTAEAISREGWSLGSDAVILASGEDFPDALAGAVVAYAKNAPILISYKDALPEATLEAIERLKPQKVYILGGIGAISSSVENMLKQQYSVERISGQDRYETAISIGESVMGISKADTAVIATGMDFPDALSAAPISAVQGMPILFSESTGLNRLTIEALKSWNIKKAVVVGGTGVVPTTVEDQLKSMGITVERISGADRYATSLAIAEHYDQGSYDSIFLATGADFPDALTGAVLAAKCNAPVLLMPQDVVTDDIVEYVHGQSGKKMYILGGSGVVSDYIAYKLFLP